ncbi:MAG TPA: FAD-dependent oxidoreductase [Phycisphaerales bacterium]|nr:FAD-dependent oxidoreductase [Phycisphaerales bacterium]HMP37447.1 FAD-dependent oxidoreductase [Phycisphaerales bacterium]
MPDQPTLPARAHPIDCVIIGGGVAGLFALDAVIRSGRSALLLEAGELGSGQTCCAQGILHGGFKYTLRGLLTASAEAVARMPEAWRASLAGSAEPDLRSVRVRSPFCHLWQTRSLVSSLGMLGARAGLRTAPRTISDEERPAPLRGAPGVVARIDEQVIDPLGVVRALADRHRGSVLAVDRRNGVEFRAAKGRVDGLSLIRPDDGQLLELRPSALVLCAGAGNEAIREACGLDPAACQRRPLHMAMVRGRLPGLWGHCVDGRRTRLTITAAEDAAERTIWHLGGQLAEEGVSMAPEALLRRAREELLAVLPGLEPGLLDDVEWASYHVDRAERRTPGGLRPDDAQVLREGAVLTAWPTKLVLAPRVAELVLAALPGPEHRFDPTLVEGWPRPLVALPPWDAASRWRRL